MNWKIPYIKSLSCQNSDYDGYYSPSMWSHQISSKSIKYETKIQPLWLGLTDLHRKIWTAEKLKTINSKKNDDISLKLK